jgi:hypothetical protein
MPFSHCFIKVTIIVHLKLQMLSYGYFFPMTCCDVTSFISIYIITQAKINKDCLFLT